MNHWILQALRRLLPALVCCTLWVIPPAQAEGVTAWHGDRSVPQIAITIDDCYSREHLTAAIELSETYGTPFTFFPVGSGLKYADGPLWQRALDAGCEIGNHTWGHKDLTRCSPPTIRFQLLRPPYGNTNGQVARAAQSIGYQWVINWDVSQTDPVKALGDVQNGSILLYHARQKDIRCLKRLIPQLLAAGYECVTVFQLMGLELPLPTLEIYSYRPADAYI